MDAGSDDLCKILKKYIYMVPLLLYNLHLDFSNGGRYYESSSI